MAQDKEDKLAINKTTRFPMVVDEAIGKCVEIRKQDFSRYNDADLIRTAVVEYLKAQGFLDPKYDLSQE